MYFEEENISSYKVLKNLIDTILNPIICKTIAIKE